MAVSLAFLAASALGGTGRELPRRCVRHGRGCVFALQAAVTGAARYWERALALYADLGVPEKAQVRAELDKLAAQALHRAPRNYPDRYA